MVQKELPGVSPVLASDPAVVVLSGGQDSMTCLALALSRHDRVIAVSFLYGQKHRTELRQAALVADRHNVPHAIIDLSFFGMMVTSELTHDGGDTTQPHPYKPGLPASFVPNRNALFLTLAHAIAQEQHAKYVYTGVCQTDYSGYPDCRQEFITELEHALNVGYQTDIKILTPMMDIDKAATFQMAYDLGVLTEIIEDSHTCYNGDRTVRHEWGYGCGKCPACEIRARGYTEFVARRADADGDHKFAASLREPRTSDMADQADAEKGSLLREPTKAPTEVGPIGGAKYKPQGFA